MTTGILRFFSPSLSLVMVSPSRRHSKIFSSRYNVSKKVSLRSSALEIFEVPEVSSCFFSPFRGEKMRVVHRIELRHDMKVSWMSRRLSSVAEFPNSRVDGRAAAAEGRFGDGLFGEGRFGEGFLGEAGRGVFLNCLGAGMTISSVSDDASESDSSASIWMVGRRGDLEVVRGEGERLGGAKTMSSSDSSAMGSSDESVSSESESSREEDLEDEGDSPLIFPPSCFWSLRIMSSEPTISRPSTTKTMVFLRAAAESLIHLPDLAEQTFPESQSSASGS